MAADRALLEAIGCIARKQNGSIMLEQLQALGLTRRDIRTMLRRRQLFRIHRGVFSVADPALLPLLSPTAAVLALGAGAILSHRSAAALWSLAKPDPDIVEVTVVGRKARQRDGIRVHRIATMDQRDITRRFNIPVTTAARAIVDFAAQANGLELEKALAEGIARSHVTEVQVQQALSRAPAHHAGAARVRALIEQDGGTPLTRSDGERALRRLLREADLPQPRSNVTLHGFEIDLYWPEARLAVELDGFDAHKSRAKFESDRRRDRVLAANAIQSLRLTGRQLKFEPTATIVHLAQAMARRCE